MKTFVDQETGKKFQLGSRGYDQLLKRTLDYAEKRRNEGIREIAICPIKLYSGDKFKCDTCDEIFEFDGEDQKAFIEGIMEHGRAHGTCQILPVV